MNFLSGSLYGFAAALWLVLYSGGGLPSTHIREWSTKPYCITETIVDREYTRCWKVVEVPPPAKEGK